MPKRTIYNVQPTGDGDWEVKRRGAKRASNVFEDKQDAVDRGRDLAKQQQPGQLLIKDKHGVIQTEHTYKADPEKYPG